MRLLIDKVEGDEPVKPQGCIYFRCADIALAVAELTKRGAIVHAQAAIDRQDGRPRPLDGVLHRSRRPYARADAGGTEGICAGVLIVCMTIPASLGWMHRHTKCNAPPVTQSQFTY